MGEEHRCTGCVYLRTGQYTWAATCDLGRKGLPKSCTDRRRTSLCDAWQDGRCARHPDWNISLVDCHFCEDRVSSTNYKVHDIERYFEGGRKWTINSQVKAAMYNIFILGETPDGEEPECTLDEYDPADYGRYGLECFVCRGCGNSIPEKQRTRTGVCGYCGEELPGCDCGRPLTCDQPTCIAKAAAGEETEYEEDTDGDADEDLGEIPNE